MGFRTIASILASALAIGALGFAPQGGKPGTVDQAKLAKTLVNDCGGFQTGELVLIEGGERDLRLLESVAIELRRIGAQPLITFGSDRLTLSSYTEVPEKFDAQEPILALKLAETINGVISVDHTERADLLAEVDDARVAARARAMEPVHRKMLERGVVNVHLGNGLYPSKHLAEQYGVAQNELSRIFWEGVNVDYNKLQTLGANVQSKLATGRTLHITAPNGTDLTVDIAQRRVYVSDGVVSSEDRTESGPACQVWLPAGEVYLTPVKGTAKGTFVADNFYYEGKRIEGLTLTFDAGRLTAMTAKGDITKLKQSYDAAGEGKDLFSAIDLGINPKVQAPAKSRLVTWMGSGTISVGCGNDVWAGGDNKVPFDLFAHLVGGTLAIDEQKLIENGKLLVE